MTTIGSIPVAAGPVTGAIAGRPVVLRYGDRDTEYAALRHGAMLVDRGHRTRTVLSGPAAAETLTGLVTNDVVSLTVGHGQYAAALTPKGKIIADLRVFARAGDLLVDVPSRAAAGWTAMLKKFVNPRLARVADVTDATGDVGLYGVEARRIAGSVLGIGADALGGLPPFGHITATIDGTPATVAYAPELGLDGYEIFGPREALAAVWQRARTAGATPAGLDAWDVARIEAGRPEWGIDIDDGTIPQEANMDEMHAISYTKGCYTGQEVVARVHFRGRVNRHLRGLHYPADAALPPRTALLDADGKAVGDVRSCAVSPRLGGVALGMVRREVPVSTIVLASWEGGEVPVTVAMLPFPL